MKKTILLLLLFFNALVGFTQAKYYYDYYCGIYGTYWIPTGDSTNYYSFVDMDTLAKGEIIFYDANGKIFAQDYYENGKLTQSRHFHKNGKKKYFKKNKTYEKPLEENIDYRNVLNIIINSTYIKNLWDSLGSKISLNDSFLFTDHYPNGKIMTVGEYHNRFPSGTWKFYYQNGNLMCQGSYSGMYNQYFTDFILSSAGDTLVKRGKGKFTVTYPNGKPSYTGEYNSGVLINLLQAYYPNGQLWYKVNCKNGKYDGRYESYYANGSVKTIGNYRNSRRSGEWKLYDNQGKLIKYHNFKNDNGIW